MKADYFECWEAVCCRYVCAFNKHGFCAELSDVGLGEDKKRRKKPKRKGQWDERKDFEYVLGDRYANLSAHRNKALMIVCWVEGAPKDSDQSVSQPAKHVAKKRPLAKVQNMCRTVFVTLWHPGLSTWKEYLFLIFFCQSIGKYHAFEETMSKIRLNSYGKMVKKRANFNDGLNMRSETYSLVLTTLWTVWVKGNEFWNQNKFYRSQLALIDPC